MYNVSVPVRSIFYPRMGIKYTACGNYFCVGDVTLPL